ncbi:hypothetical protein OG369_13845 [Streptomyces sp. NBC_01221]|uniref:hypothetical protein n=1 Tax=unclassified Streptomyces TaxID=2593676 RepID=UPI00224CC581|nr:MULTISPECIES: hypothetical protein [unclassified Streptomyces]MCX4787231.1 hypothetical protein [Streptomyces sp. NBC_01221]MCX4796986.1 hypothetical protein [Streptomyces sp. NBC_01242]WSP55538.1 hypothetical protein OG306_14905 [Streptomyces sp. NBC_01241]
MIRLLPWTGADGKPNYLSTDGTGPLSRLADQIEYVQLGLAGKLLDHVRVVLSGSTPETSELRLLTAQLADALRDTLLIAESRGNRLTPADTDVER